MSTIANLPLGSASTPDNVTQQASVIVTQVLPLYGPRGWRVRSRDKFPFRTDAALRWFVAEHRSELMARRVLVLLAGRLCGLMPGFELAVIEIGICEWGGRVGESDARDSRLHEMLESSGR